MVLILRVQGGFCNRIRAIVSGVLWAEDLNRKLVVYWPVEPGHMPCSFDQIFLENSVPRLCCVHTGYISKAHAVQSKEDMETVLQVFGHEAEEIRIESYSHFHPDALGLRGNVILRSLEVKRHILESARDLWESVDGKSSMIGVHFRGTDFRNRILRDGTSASRLEEILDLMRVQPLTTQFLLVTDEPEAAVLIQTTFPGRVLDSGTSLKGRTTSNQQLDGVLDWLLLQNCSKILASRGSSFSEVAAQRAGVPLLTQAL